MTTQCFGRKNGRILASVQYLLFVGLQQHLRDKTEARQHLRAKKSVQLRIEDRVELGNVRYCSAPGDDGFRLGLRLQLEDYDG